VTRSPRVMMLIDADNVSADVIEQALDQVLQSHGAAHVRRAYCTPESAVKNATLFKRLGLRPMVNLSTGKNATDIALAVDALDLAVAERPDVAVIVSSDSDFAPLVLRLREKGCRVEGIGQQGKTSDGSKGVYDDFVDLVHRKPAARAPARASRATAAAPVAAPAEAIAPRAAAPAPAPAKTPSTRTRRAAPAALPGEPTPTTVAPKDPPTAGRRRRGAGGARNAEGPAALDLDLDLDEAAPAPRAGASSPPRAASVTSVSAAMSLPDEVAAILKAVPPLAGGQPVALGIAAERLRAAGLLARSAASTRLFRKLAAHFALAPSRQPNTVQFIGTSSPA
jgi:predicted nuclease of predicted toxin-antitoxin system